MIGLDVLGALDHPLTDCAARGREFARRAEALGAMGLPSGRELAPYLLTLLPKTASEVEALYDAYLRALDQVTASFSSWAHPVNAGAVNTALLSVRGVAAELRAQGKTANAVQLLASAIGYVNARYRTPTGDVDWKALDTPVNAGIFETAAATAQTVADAARGVGDALQNPLRTLTGVPWWGWALGATAALTGGGYLLWRILGREGAREVAIRRLGG